MKLRYYFEPFIEYKVQKGCGKHTIGEYRRFIATCLIPTIGERRISQLRAVDQARVQQEGRQHGYWGEQRAVSVFLQFCKYLEQRGERLQFRLDLIALPQTRDREQDFLTEQEFTEFIAKVSTETFYGLRDRLMYELLWTTGLRIGEALAINKSDINFEKGEIKINTFKGGEGDKVYISESLEHWLKQYLDQRVDENEALFIVFWMGNVVRYKKCLARKNLAAYREKFGIVKHITHHAFRRGYCTNLLNKGANIKEVQILARHRSERTTLKFYTKVTKGQVKSVHQRIFGWLQKV